MKDRPQTEAGAGVRPDASSGNHMEAGAVNKTNRAIISPAPDNPRWESFDTWLQRYERATGADSYRPGLPGSPRGY
jgi:hypothetical protein